MQFVKKPIPIEAVRWTGNNLAEVKAWITERVEHHAALSGNPLIFEGKIALFVKRRATGVTEELWKNIAGEDWGKDITAAVYDYLHLTYVGVKDGQWIMCGTEGEFYPCADDGTGTAPLNYEKTVLQQNKEVIQKELSESIRMPVIVDETIPPGTFILQRKGHEPVIHEIHTPGDQPLTVEEAARIKRRYTTSEDVIRNVFVMADGGEQSRMAMNATDQPLDDRMVKEQLGAPPPVPFDAGGNATPPYGTLPDPERNM